MNDITIEGLQKLAEQLFKHIGIIKSDHEKQLIKKDEAIKLLRARMELIRTYEIKDESDGWVKDMAGVTLEKVDKLLGEGNE